MSFNPTVSGISGATDVALSNPQNNHVLSYDNTTAKWTNKAVSSAAADATTTSKGSVQLAGDLGGTASSPTVPGLANKADTDHTHTVATTSAAGFMSAADKIKLNGVASSANNYSHPTGDGNLHVPATSTTSNGRFLKAGASAGSVSWSALSTSDIASGTMAPVRLGSGTASTSTYLRGDGSWAVPAVAGAGYTPVARSSDYTANDKDFVVCDTSSNGFTVTLPTPAPGAAVRVLKLDGSVNAVIVIGNGNPTLAGSASYSVNVRWTSQDFMSDGTDWYCV